MNFYGFLIALGILIAIFVVEKFRKNKPFEIGISVFDIFPWIVIPGIIGARIYHMISFRPYYKQNPGEIFLIWQGGLGIFGALVGGVLGLFLFAKFTKLTRKDFLKLVDVICLSLPLAQAIGRWGNFLNEELYGLPTKLPWGIFISPENRLPGYENFSRFHPLFLYESFWDLAIFLILIKNKDKLKNGKLFLLYLFLYCLGRFWLEFLRIDSWLVGKFRINQLISLVLIFFSIFFLINKKFAKN